MPNLILYSLFAFMAGILFNLMPCVLPVMPFKIQAILREIKSDRVSRLLAAMALLAGSVGVFLILGIAMVYLGLIWGELFQARLFQGGLSLFLLLSAVATFADWAVRLPRFLYRFPAQKYMGAVATGALAGILSTPCSGPFLGSVLAYSVTQAPASALVLFLSIGIGLAFPYVILLTWPGLLNRLRFSGPWTVQIKHCLGFILLGGAVFFSRPLVPAVIHTTGWLLLTGAIVVWALRLVVRAGTWSERALPITVLGSLAMIALMTTGGLMNAPGDLNWQPFSEDKLKLARSEARPVMIEFTADWCLNCKVLEKTVFRSQTVAAAVKKTVLLPLRVDITEVNAANKALLTRYKGFAIPYVVLLNREGLVSDQLTGIFSAQTMAAAILKAGGAG